jgi:hypothetical protein
MLLTSLEITVEMFNVVAVALDLIASLSSLTVLQLVSTCSQHLRCCCTMSKSPARACDTVRKFQAPALWGMSCVKL